MTADQFGGRALPRGAQLAQPGRRCRAEGPHLAEQPVAGGAVTSGRAVDVGLGVQQLKQIPDGDVGQHAALGGQHDRRPAQRAGAGRLGLAAAEPPSHSACSRANPSGSRSADMARASSACSHPPATSQAREGRTMPAPTAVIKAETSAEVTGTSRPDRWFSQQPGSLPPRNPGGIGSAGQPALLPAAAFLGRQPVQQCPQRPPARAAGRERPVHLLTGLRVGLSVRVRRPRRETDPRGPVTRQPHRRRPRRGHPGGHHDPCPNSTSRLSGR